MFVIIYITFIIVMYILVFGV
jgi:hypothetical protein